MKRHPLPLMPVSVLVIDKEYQIVNEPPPPDYDGEDNDDNSGCCNSSHCEIYVDPTESEPAQRDTLLHELLHAIERGLDINLREKQVGLLAVGILQMLRANPPLVAYLTNK